MYRKALAGEIPRFTGVTDPYEEPTEPELVLETDKLSPGESIAVVFGRVVALGVPPPRGSLEIALQWVHHPKR